MTELQRSALLALAACLLSVGCVSTGGERGARDREIAAADLGRVPSAELGIENDQPIGIYLTELHGRMERWFLLRSSGTPDSARIRDVLEVEIQRFVQGREDELVFELAQGPVRNRVIAAAGLGFSTSEVALGPLLAALDDPELEVRRQALLGLGLLADPQAPTDELTTILRMDSDAGARHNACYALFRMVGQGARSPEIATAFRLALLDAEAAVRVQAARGLGVLVDGAAVDDLAAVLNDDVDLVSMADRGGGPDPARTGGTSDGHGLDRRRGRPQGSPAARPRPPRWHRSRQSPRGLAALVPGPALTDGIRTARAGAKISACEHG
ncbi:MAG: HEAT repeat domain-containing protein, partial [Planctomycetota bacterium]